MFLLNQSDHLFSDVSMLIGLRRLCLKVFNTDWPSDWLDGVCVTLPGFDAWMSRQKMSDLDPNWILFQLIEKNL